MLDRSYHTHLCTTALQVLQEGTRDKGVAHGSWLMAHGPWLYAVAQRKVPECRRRKTNQDHGPILFELSI